MEGGKRVKLVFEDGVVRRLHLSLPPKFESITEFLDLVSNNNNNNNPSPALSQLSYLDEEGDSITVATDEELEEAFRVCGERNVLKLKVTQEAKQEPVTPQPPSPSPFVPPSHSVPPPHSVPPSHSIPPPHSPPPPHHHAPRRPHPFVNFLEDLLAPSRPGDPPLPFNMDWFVRFFCLFSIPFVPFVYALFPICGHAYVSAVICFVLVAPTVAPGLNRLAFRICQEMGHPPHLPPNNKPEQEKKPCTAPLFPFIIALLSSLALPPCPLFSLFLFVAPNVFIHLRDHPLKPHHYRLVFLALLFATPLVFSSSLPLPLFVGWVVCLPVLYHFGPFVLHYCQERHEEFQEMTKLMKEIRQNEEKKKQKKQKKQQKRATGVKEDVLPSASNYE